MTYDISTIASWLGLPRPEREMAISRLLTDSRSLTDPSETLFFALRTPSGDGHKYIKELYAKWVRAFVVEQLPADISELTDAVFLVVPSPLDALQKIAGRHREQCKDTKVIGITGSQGKTTVKEWLYTLMRAQGLKVARSPRSYNSQTGVPLSLWEIDPSDEVALIEAGISHTGEMERLSRIIRPDITIITGIGDEHQEGFASIEEKAREKALLARGAKEVIYCGNDKLLADILGDTAARCDKKITLPFTDDALRDDAVLCIRTLQALGCEVRQEDFDKLRPVETRLEVIEGVNGCRLVLDSFTADTLSLAPALDFAKRRLTPGQRFVVILGDLDEDYLSVTKARGKAIRMCRDFGVNEVILTFDKPIGEMRPGDFHNSLILLKGSSKEPFGHLVDILEAKQHETVLEINLDAVVHNFNYFRSLIRPTTGICCMIKASGYGAGAGELAKTLQSQGASYLAVAVHDEGAQLRQEGITMPIIVLNPMVDSFDTLFSNRLEPEIYSIDFLKSLIREAQRLGIEEYPVHIKIDSGMHRLGFRLETLPEVIELLKGQTHVVPKSIFSHLCCADDPAEDDYTRGQFDYFDKCSEMLLSAFPGRKILRHILNSTGITRFPDRQFDMVRLGIGLYGVKTMHDGSQDALRPVSALRSMIISLKEWPAGTTIGYNRRGRLTRESVIATVPIGYADGLNRHLGYGNARFNIRGVMCPTVGSICMDACMVDVTDVPGVSVGDRVEIFGDTIPVDILAQTLDTIPYEVLTSVSERVKRVYFRE